MSSQIIAASVFLLVMVLATGSLSIVMGMYWLGLAILVVACILYGVFLGKSRQTRTTK